MYKADKTGKWKQTALVFIKYCCNVLRLLSDQMIRNENLRRYEENNGCFTYTVILPIIKKHRKRFDHGVYFTPLFHIPVKFPHKNMDPDRSAKMKAGIS